MCGPLPAAGLRVIEVVGSITSDKRASACQLDVHQGCTPVGQRGAIIPGSAPMVLALHPSLYTSLPSMLLFSSSSPLAGGVWTTQCDLAARGGIQGGAPRPQVRPELNLPPSILLLPPPPLGANFTNPPPPCAQQANQAISLCDATWGPGGQRKGGG